ncbi:hypothetical protein EGK75_07480 [Neisseria weixii]|uniref:HK97 family phage prohead protease n=2 Tax=Neisseria weixii TaxID=1853276 RepID=A0A3N4MQS8_9NEIS|nr:hypothetical protein EGK74_08195 [Neisseria weixii]RPD87198.1 hypothetical protein EGK75_07480 [Neisseria weixii]
MTRHPPPYHGGMNTKTPLKIKLSAAGPVSLLTAADAPRSFKGTANSGKPFGYGSYQTVIDFDGLKHKPKMPVLLEHSPVKMAGVCSLSVTSDGLIAEGTLLDNEHGNEIAAAADQGFPWEMSVYVQAASYEELSAGATETVNGHEVTGPVVIMRQCTIREVSFTAVGVDGNTEAVVLSDGAPFKPFAKMELSMTKEEQAAFDELKAEVAALKEEKAAAQAEAEKAKAEKKKADVAAKLSAAGFKQTADGWDGLSQATVNLLLSAEPEAAATIIADLKPTAQAAAIPPALLSDSPAAPAAEEGVKLSAATATSTFNKGLNYV